MSSSNRVRLGVIEEVNLGETPASGNFSTARVTSESLSGTPTVTESQQIRPDRQSSGQVITGLEVGGDINFELAKDPTFEALLSGVMMSNWETQAAITADLTLVVDDVTDPEKPVYRMTRAAGDFGAALDVGDIFATTGFDGAENNTTYQVLEIESPLSIRVNADISNGEPVAEVGEGTTFKRFDRLSVGTTQKSFSLEKAFLDLDDKAIVYKGMVGNTFSLNVAYGELITGTLGFLGTEQTFVDDPTNFITNGRTINNAATTKTMNGSIDMPFLASSALGALDPNSFCIQSLSLSLDNNNTALNCIGRIGPSQYSAGQASISVDLSAYLSDDTWGFLARKLDQQSFGIGFVIKNEDGAYGFFLPAVQVSFDDPSIGGANQEISLEMSGQAKIGPAGENMMYIYRL